MSINTSLGSFEITISLNYNSDYLSCRVDLGKNHLLYFLNNVCLNMCAVVGLSICVFVVATLVSIKVHVSKRNLIKKEGQLLQSVADA